MRLLLLIIVSVAATLMLGCEQEPSRADRLRKEAEMNGGSLYGDGIAELLRSGEDRQALAEIAAEYDSLYYDGATRFAQVSGWRSLATNAPVISIQMASDAPDGFARNIALRGDKLPKGVDIRFDQTGIVIAVTTQDGTQEHRADWAPSTIPPFGSIDLDTGKAEIKQ